jgi:hypothetical protein
MKLASMILLAALPGLLLADEPSTRVSGPPKPSASDATVAAAEARQKQTPEPKSTPPSADTAVQLRTNLHAMRVAIEQDEAAEQMSMRANGPMMASTQDSGSIATLRNQLSDVMAHLDSRCIGVNAHNDGGNLILICGDNNGANGQSQISQTDVARPTALPAAAASTAAGAASPGASP